MQIIYIDIEKYILAAGRFDLNVVGLRTKNSAEIYLNEREGLSSRSTPDTSSLSLYPLVSRGFEAQFFLSVASPISLSPFVHPFSEEERASFIHKSF